jgi:hypothetical protein
MRPRPHTVARRVIGRLCEAAVMRRSICIAATVLVTTLGGKRRRRFGLRGPHRYCVDGKGAGPHAHPGQAAAGDRGLDLFVAVTVGPRRLAPQGHGRRSGLGSQAATPDDRDARDGTACPETGRTLKRPAAGRSIVRSMSASRVIVEPRRDPLNPQLDSRRRANSAMVTTWGATTGQILALREHLGAGTLAVSAPHAPVPKSTAVVVTFPVRILRAVLYVPRRVVELDIPGRLALGVRLGGECARLLSGRRVGQGHRRGGDRYCRGTSRQQWCDEAPFPRHGDPFLKLNVQFP